MDHSFAQNVRKVLPVANYFFDTSISMQTFKPKSLKDHAIYALLKNSKIIPRWYVKQNVLEFLYLEYLEILLVNSQSSWLELYEEKFPTKYDSIFNYNSNNIKKELAVFLKTPALYYNPYSFGPYTLIHCSFYIIPYEFRRGCDETAITYARGCEDCYKKKYNKNVQLVQRCHIYKAVTPIYMDIVLVNDANMWCTICKYKALFDMSDDSYLIEFGFLRHLYIKKLKLNNVFFEIIDQNNTPIY